MKLFKRLPQVARSESYCCQADPKCRVGYFFIVYPKITETFNLREMLWIARNGCSLTLFSLAHPKPNQKVQPEGVHLLKYTHYANWLLSGDLIISNSHFIRQCPKRYFSLISRIILETWQSPITLFKSLAIFPKSVHFAALAQSEHLDHLHATFGSHNATSAWISSNLTGIPYSVTVDAYDLYIETALLERKLSDAQFVTTISALNKQILEARYGSSVITHTHINRRGIDLSRFKPLDTQQDSRNGNEIFRILCVGSLQIKKGQRYLIEAIGRLISEGRQIHCSLIGDGPTQDSLKRQVVKAGLLSHITFHGSQTQAEVLSHLQRTDIFVLPSVIGPSNRMEGIPNALMEAMACELPVIGTDLSGTPELISHLSNGILVPPGDVEALSQAIAQLQDDPALAHRLGRAARLTIQTNFNQEINIAFLHRLYRQAIATPNKKILASEVANAGI